MRIGCFVLSDSKKYGVDIPLITFNILCNLFIILSLMISYYDMYIAQ